MQNTDIANPDYFHKVVDCQWACPAHTPVPEYIRLIAAGRYSDAYMIEAAGHAVDRLRIRAFPFHSSVTSFIADHDFVFVVEQNRDAQLRSLIVNECNIDPVRLVPVLHYDGTPITARFIASDIAQKLAQLKVVPFEKAAS